MIDSVSWIVISRIHLLHWDRQGVDTNDLLQQLSSRLEHHGLLITVNEPEMRITVTSPLNSRPSEEILVVGDRYVTGFDDEVGVLGAEQECADRILRILAVSRTAGGAYRRHLDRCPDIHLGILANCPEGARLRAAREGWLLGAGTSAHA